MKHSLRYSALLCCLTIGVALSIESRALAVADLTNWVGFNNAPPDQNPSDAYGPEENNYVVDTSETPPTAAGGTFKSRRTRPSTAAPNNVINKAYLAGPLQGSTLFESTAYGFQENFSASGTLSFSNPNGVDPQFFFGFFNNGPLNNNDPEFTPGLLTGIHRLGLSVGDVTAGNFFRVQSNANGGSPATNSAVTLSPNGVAPSPGQNPVAYVAGGVEYDFEFSYTFADDPLTTEVNETRLFKASITDGTNTFFHNRTLPVAFIGPEDAEPLTAFGFLQFGDSVDSPPPEPAFSLTYTFNVSDIDYTGDVDAPQVDLDGDHNGDDVVDAADYVAWRKLNIDDAQGYDDFVENFGESIPNGGGGAIPEPSSAVLALMGLVLAGNGMTRLRARLQ